jgi:hypothetical protein
VTPAVTRVLIDSIRQSLYRNYIFPDTALKMIRYVEAEYKKGTYAAITDPQKLVEQLNKDLQKGHHDGQFNIFYNPRFARDLSDTVGQAARQRQGDSMQLAHRYVNVNNLANAFCLIDRLEVTCPQYGSIFPENN